jgi:hypothetical protein
MGIFDKVVNAVAPKCSFCSERLLKNRKSVLMHNFKTLSYTLKKIDNAKYICSNCVEKLKRQKCDSCAKVILASDNKAEELKAYKMLPSIYRVVCENCLKKLIKQHKEIELSFKNWIGGTKSEYIKGYRVVKNLGVVKYNANYCSDPSEVEEKLKLFSAQLGGNGLIKFFWNKEIEKSSKKVLAGYSKNDNPYYKTKYSTKTYFTGSATAVYLEVEKDTNKINTNIDDASYKYVIECSQVLEKYIENNLNGKGKGLHEKITSIEDELSAKDIKSFRFIATARNNIIHEGKIIGDSEQFKNTCEQLKLKYNLK